MRGKYSKSASFLNESFCAYKKPIYCLCFSDSLATHSRCTNGGIFMKKSLLIEKYSLKIRFDIGFAIVFHLLFLNARQSEKDVI